jgi:hypothetical protein
MWRELYIFIKKYIMIFSEKWKFCDKMPPDGPPQENPLVQHLPHNFLQRRDEARGCENASSSDSSTLV